MQQPDIPGHRGQDGTMSENGPTTPSASRYSRRNDESWVEIASQPSSSSLSSVGDEIVTTGLRVGGSAPARRRRLQQQSLLRSHLAHQNHASTADNTSSQEEYDESESEEDRVMSSSAENIPSPRRLPLSSLQHQVPRGADDQRPMLDSDSDDENATALGIVTERPAAFRPQPNAFSHPPTHLSHRSHSTNSSLPNHPHGSLGGRPMLSTRSHTRVPRNFMSPSYQADNDAALRASLTTLLSCAAAARGLPKKETEDAVASSSRPGVGPSNQPMELLFVPESELIKDGPPPPPSTRPASSSSASGTSSPTREKTVPTPAVSLDKGKRAASGPSRSARAAKKKKMAAVSEEALISPTLLTWVVGASVVVLVSVVGFGAGYVIGREVGRQETLAAGAGLNASSVADTGSCGREVIRSSGGGLRRFKWTSMARSVSA